MTFINLIRLLFRYLLPLSLSLSMLFVCHETYGQNQKFLFQQTDVRAQPFLLDGHLVTPPEGTKFKTLPSRPSLMPLPADYLKFENEWLTLFYPSGSKSRVLPIFSEGDQIKARLCDWLGIQTILTHLTVRVVHNQNEMRTFGPDEVPPPDYASGVAYPFWHLVLISLEAPRSFEATDIFQVFQHELIHVALFDATQGHPIPRWFNEGLAIFGSGELSQERTEQLYLAARMGKLESISGLDSRFAEGGFEVDTAYAQSADLVRYISRQPDRHRLMGLIDRLRSGHNFDTALQDAYGTDLHKLEYEWRKSVDERKGSGLAQSIVTGSALWILGVIALSLAWWRSKRRAKKTLKTWEIEEKLNSQVEAHFIGSPYVLESDLLNIKAPESPSTDTQKVEPPSATTTASSLQAKQNTITYHEGPYFTIH